ncbi:MAG: hypothetical protein WC254_07590, partial [Candidatus Woesearchaeota archaeon]
MRKEVLLFCILFFTIIQGVNAQLSVSGLYATPNPVEYEHEMDMLFLADIINTSAGIRTVNLTINTTPEILVNLTFNGTNYTALIDTADIGLGTWNATVYADDELDNSAVLDISFMVQDTTNPALLDYSIPSFVCYGSTFNVFANATDNAGLSSVKINIEGTYYDLSYLIGDTYNQILDTNLLFTGRGSYIYDFYAEDTSGNGNLTDPAYLDVLDCTPPTISVLNATPNPVVYGNDITITSTITDETSFTVTGSLSNGTDIVDSGVLASIISDEYNITFDTTLLGN